MSFDDTRWDIEQTVIQPLRDFRDKVAPLDQLHNESVKQFATIMGGLLTGSDGGTAMQGQGSLALADLVGRFLDGEESLCGSGDELVGRLLDAATISEKRAQELEQRLNEIAIERDHTLEALSGVALTMDSGAAVQGGVDIPWDIIAIGLTGVAAIAAATQNLDAARTRDAEEARSVEIRMWENDMESGPNTEPLTRLPPDPRGPSGDAGDFLKMVGILFGAAGVVLAAGAIIVNLSPAQEDLAQRLHNDYGSSGLSLDDIRAIIAEHPNLSEAALRKLLSNYGQVTKAYPNLVNKHGALQVFLEFIALSAYDPAHGGNYSRRQPADMDRLYKGIGEAEVEMGVMEDGKIPWPLTPSPVEAYEASDPNGEKWDVKGFYSIDPGGKPFNLTTAMKKLEKEIVKNGENIILDDRNMTPEDTWKLYEALKSKGWDNNVVWWPNDPVKPGP